MYISEQALLKDYGLINLLASELQRAQPNNKYNQPQEVKLLRMSLSDFVMLSKIGEGAYSSVHKVKRISDGQIYALKKVKLSTLKQKQRQNALNEVRLLASISSDYIIKYKESFFDQKMNVLCIVMQFADGGDMEKIIEKRKKKMEWTEQTQVWNMLRCVLNGLAFLHQRNIIHRDIKCANIFICNGMYKIADLNVSKLMKQSLAYTQTGTPYYASPQVWQDKPYELKSDIWSLGCIVYELCALKPPFTSNSMEGLYKKVMKGLYPRIPAVYSQKLVAVINKCLQLQPSRRASCKDLLKMIPQGTVADQKSKTASINLLSTIKIPKNLQNWKNELPKSDYNDNLSEKSPASDRQDSSRPPGKFGHVSQQKLREIVRQKNEQALMNRKQLVKKYNPQIPLYPQSMKAPQTKKIIDRSGTVDKYDKQQKLELLPKIKLHSQPNDRISELLLRLREEQKKRYDYNRPSWWG